jgi:pilus assembly protein Flp/PilA
MGTASISPSFLRPLPGKFPGRGTCQALGLSRESKTSDTKEVKIRVKGEVITLQNFLSRLQEEKGATAVEYALLAGLIAAVVVGTVAFIGPALVPMFTAVLPGL